jgi:response regulator of citrate/malate metabolism
MRGGVLHYLIKPFAYAALFDQLKHFGALHEKAAVPADPPSSPRA